MVMLMLVVQFLQLFEEVSMYRVGKDLILNIQIRKDIDSDMFV